jgi:hypothetical protein
MRTQPGSFLPPGAVAREPAALGPLPFASSPFASSPFTGLPYIGLPFTLGQRGSPIPRPRWPAL